MEQLDPNDLLIFARVVDEGSFTAAAERLGLPKSTVSRRLSQLEERLGERLLLRTTRRLSITEFGSALLEHARQVDTEVEAVAALAESRQARPSGRLRVSMPNDFASLLLTDMLAAFSALHPAVTLELDLSPRRVDLLGENFDVAIRMGELPDDTLLAAGGEEYREQSDQQRLDPVHAQFCAIMLPVAERWQSGRMYLTRNQAYCKVPWVRIPPSPPN